MPLKKAKGHKGKKKQKKSQKRPISIKGWLNGLPAPELASGLSFLENEDVVLQMHRFVAVSKHILFSGAVGTEDWNLIESTGQKHEQRFSWVPVYGFFSQAQPQSDTDALEFHRNAEAEFLGACRIGPLGWSLDISLAPNWLNLCNTLSSGSFLKRPLYLSPSPGCDWRDPVWFRTSGYFSLATYLVSRLEIRLWALYYNLNKIIPRGDPEDYAVVSPGLPASKNTSRSTLEVLDTHWDSLTNSEKSKILSTLRPQPGSP